MHQTTHRRCSIHHLDALGLHDEVLARHLLLLLLLGGHIARDLLVLGLAALHLLQVVKYFAVAWLSRENLPPSDCI